MIVKGKRLVIPTKLTQNVLELLHETHLGATKMNTVFGLDITKQINDRVQRCATCQSNRTTLNAEPMINHTIPNAPYSKVGTDLFAINNNFYNITVNYY